MAALPARQGCPPQTWDSSGGRGCSHFQLANSISVSTSGGHTPLNFSPSVARPPPSPVQVPNKESSCWGGVCRGWRSWNRCSQWERPQSLVMSQPGTRSVGTLASDPGSEPSSSSSRCGLRPSHLASLHQPQFSQL